MLFSLKIIFAKNIWIFMHDTAYLAANPVYYYY
jgi:hypothetical protein